MHKIDGLLDFFFTDLWMIACYGYWDIHIVFWGLLFSLSFSVGILLKMFLFVVGFEKGNVGYFRLWMRKRRGSAKMLVTSLLLSVPSCLPYWLFVVPLRWMKPCWSSRQNIVKVGLPFC